MNKLYECTMSTASFKKMSADESFEYDRMKMETDNVSDKEQPSDNSNDSGDESSDGVSVNEEELEKEVLELEKRVNNLRCL